MSTTLPPAAALLLLVVVPPVLLLLLLLLQAVAARPIAARAAIAVVRLMFFLSSIEISGQDPRPGEGRGSHLSRSSFPHPWRRAGHSAADLPNSGQICQHRLGEAPRQAFRGMDTGLDLPTFPPTRPSAQALKTGTPADGGGSAACLFRSGRLSTQSLPYPGLVGATRR